MEHPVLKYYNQTIIRIDYVCTSSVRSALFSDGVGWSLSSCFDPLILNGKAPPLEV